MNFQFHIPSIHGKQTLAQRIQQFAPTIPMPTRPQPVQQRQQVQQIQQRQPVQNTAPYNAEQKRLNILRENTISQTPYTPQAVAALRKIPLNMYAQNVSPMRPQPEQAGAFYSQDNASITFNPKYMTGSNPVDFLRHEFIHSQDANITQQDPMNYMKAPGTYLDSNGFYDRMDKVDRDYISSRIGNPLYYGGKDPWIQDTEGLAYIGQTPNVMRAPFSQEYKDIYMPISLKPPSYSPMFPSPEYMMRMKRAQKIMPPAKKRVKQKTPVSKKTSDSKNKLPPTKAPAKKK